MNEPPGPSPAEGGCPTYDTLRAFAHGQVAEDLVLQIVAHLYTQCCPRCSELLLAMPETTASVFAPATPSLPVVPERPTDDVKLATASAQQNGYQPLRLGRYSIRGQVGKGGFGTVYAAHDGELGRDVAVKVPFARRFTALEQEQAAAEARLHASLDHPNIVPIYDVGRTEEIPFFFVSKLIVGQDLGTRLREGRPGIRESAELLLPLAGALAHMHGRGLVHRDVKPRNILLDEEGKPYLADFGLAMRCLPPGEGGSEDNLIAGTLAYMSPEQARGETRRIDRRTDLYALGVVLYEMLTGEKPFRGDGVAGLRHKILNEEPPAPATLEPGVPADLEAICQKAMAKDVDRRYQDAGHLAEDLRRFLADEPLRHAGRVSPGGWAWWWLRRHRGLVAASTVAVAAGILTLVLALLLAFRPPATASPLPPDGVTRAIVTVQTEPPGGRVCYYPLDETTGVPQPEKAVRAKAGEPVEIARGHYLVVAALGDRFHEVFRLVPGGKDGGLSGPFRHRRFKLIDGVLHLETIVLPKAAVAEGMCLFPGGNAFSTNATLPRIDKAGQLVFPRQTLRQPSFYLDLGEVRADTYHDWLHGQDAGQLPLEGDPTHPAVGVTWDHAIAFAEWSGKRLPDEMEYEYAARRCGKARFPWGDSEEPLKTKWILGPVGKPAYDRLEEVGQPAVTGLYSNVGEWTSSWAGEVPGGDPSIPPSMMRVARGAPMSVLEGKQAIPPVVGDPSDRIALRYTDKLPGLGFRCARSAKPRWEAQDFGGPAGR